MKQVPQQPISGSPPGGTGAPATFACDGTFVTIERGAGSIKLNADEAGALDTLLEDALG